MNIHCFISQRAVTCRRQRGWLMVYRPSFFLFSFLFRNWSQPILIRSSKCFYPHTNHDPGLSTQVLNFENLTYFTGCKKPQKNAFFTCFSWVTSRFRSLRKNGLGYSKTKNGWIIYNDLPFIRYIIEYCGASSSPDHRVRNLIKFRKGVSALMATSWLLRIDYSLRIPMDVGLYI